MPKISIITINFNDAKGLLKTMLSVNEQTYSDIEHVIIDGLSSDNSLEIIEQNKMPFTRWVSEKDKGIYDAQNKGIEQTKGEYLIFLNAGDYLADKTVLQQIAPRLDGIDLLYGDMQTCDADGKIEHLKMHPRITKKVLYTDTIWHPVSFFRKALFENFGNYDLGLKIVSDYDLYCRYILKHNISTRYIPVEVAVFDTTGVSSSPEKREHLKAERRLVQNRYFNPSLLFLFRLYSKLRN